jgi:hypothetical protein
VGQKKARPPPRDTPDTKPLPFRLFANLGCLDYVTLGADNDLIVVGRYGTREICITVPGSEVAGLIARLRLPLAKRKGPS